MAITLNGTTGITTPDIDTDGLSVDTNAIFVDPATNNVGIGTSAPVRKLDVLGEPTVAGFYRNVDVGVVGAASMQVELGARSGTTSTAGGSIGAQLNNATTGELQLYSRTGGALTEKVRINSGGNLLVGTTSNPPASGLVLQPDGRMNIGTASGANKVMMGFFNGGNLVGRIDTSTSATSFITSSDYRLKEDAQPVANPIERLMQLKPINFAWKIDGSRTDGFLAHEAQEVVPDAVTGTKDAVETVDVTDEEGKVIGTEVKPVHQGIDQSKLVPLLAAAIQEQQTLIQALTARIEALEQA